MKKTRNLSIVEYFLILQKEYLIAEFRRKIYYNPKDKEYYQRVMQYKKIKIENIALKNNLNDIFNSSERYKEIWDQLFENGRPKFQLSDTDIHNYFLPENDFIYKGKIYTLKEILNNDDVVLYSNELKQTIITKKSEIYRIL